MTPPWSSPPHPTLLFWEIDRRQEHTSFSCSRDQNVEVKKRFRLYACTLNPNRSSESGRTFGGPKMGIFLSFFFSVRSSQLIRFVFLFFFSTSTIVKQRNFTLRGIGVKSFMPGPAPTSRNTRTYLKTKHLVSPIHRLETGTLPSLERCTKASRTGLCLSLHVYIERGEVPPHVCSGERFQ